MRRVIALILTVLVLGGVCEAAGKGGFTFRNGLTWGMSQREVLAAEGKPRYQTNREYGMDVIEIDNAAHRGSKCEINYLFYSGGLVMGKFSYNAESVSIDTIKEALIGRYGEATEVDPKVIAEVTLEDDAPDRCFGWVIDDATLVFLTEDKSARAIRLLVSDLTKVAETPAQ